MNISVLVAACTHERRSEHASRRSIPTALTLAVCGSILLLAALLSPPVRSGRLESADISQACSEWDAKAVEALARHNLNGPKVGPQFHVRTAPLWLAEARRSCADGLIARAQHLYRGIIDWHKQT
jgi:hypothetical protein